ncbi:MAG TPA: hypothetical protein VGH90_05905 [Chthoniobacteraceae bacterium]|jgi:predicted Zn-ribbon and HTH transcriptional regulator
MGYILVGLRLNLPLPAFLAWLGAGGVAEIFGVLYVIRLSKRQSIDLGFTCPRCGGPLYDGRSNRLGFRGECPRCKQFVIEQFEGTAG